MQERLVEIYGLIVKLIEDFKYGLFIGHDIMLLAMQKPRPPKESFGFEIYDLAPTALAGPIGDPRLKLRDGS